MCSSSQHHAPLHRLSFLVACLATLVAGRTAQAQTADCVAWLVVIRGEAAPTDKCRLPKGVTIAFTTGNWSSYRAASRMWATIQAPPGVFVRLVTVACRPDSSFDISCATGNQGGSGGSQLDIGVWVRSDDPDPMRSVDMYAETTWRVE